MTTQEELVRQIMAEVMKDLSKHTVTYSDAHATRQSDAPSTYSGSHAHTSGGAAQKAVGLADYPLAEKRPDLIRLSSGEKFSELTFEKVKSGAIDPRNFRITAETLELQAQVASASGREPLARNLRRAAELVAVPDDRLLEIYNALRPYRSTKQELLDIAEELKTTYHAPTAHAWVLRAAEVYEQRGRLRED